MREMYFRMSNRPDIIWTILILDQVSRVSTYPILKCRMFRFLVKVVKHSEKQRINYFSMLRRKKSYVKCMRDVRSMHVDVHVDGVVLLRITLNVSQLIKVNRFARHSCAHVQYT